jgi:metal-sulfur cluster biosynthetic enzyme
MKKIFLAIIFLCFLTIGILYAKSPELLVFGTPTCNKCIEAEEEIIPQIKKEFSGKIQIKHLDITEVENFKVLLGLKDKYPFNVDDILPVYFLNGNFLAGKITIEKLKVFINQSLAKPVRPKEAVAEIDLLKRFKQFKPMAVAFAGLIDGINPCAFTVIVFFISFLVVQGYKRREMLIIGLAYLVAVFITYILFGLGLMNFLYRLEMFRLLSRAINIAIGILSIFLGFLALYDIFVYLKTRETEGLTLQLPKLIKNKIHSIIGRHYRNPSKEKEGTKKKSVLGLLLSALLVGFLVSTLEAICTGQVYLPTITFILKTTSLKLQALTLLLLYNIMFIVPLLAVFILALLGVTSEQFSHFLKRHMFLIKIFLAAVFFSFGTILVYAHSIPRQIYKTNTLKQARIASLKDIPDMSAPLDYAIFDFGKVKQGEVLKHTFSLKNDSTKNVLNIKNVHTSCGCTASEVKKKILRPQEETSIEVEFNTKGYLGQVKQYIYVHTDNKEQPVLRLTIKAEIGK